MPMNTSGQLRITDGTTVANVNAVDAVANYWTGRMGGTVTEKSNFNFYRNNGAGRNFYYSPGTLVVRSGAISMSFFYGSSPIDEWNCACSK
jgi:hypothetical protein